MTSDEPAATVLTHVGGNVRRWRVRAGLSQQELADAAGVSRRTIINLEAGQANVSLSAVDAIAAAVGATFVDLVRGPTAGSANLDEVLWRGTGAASVAILHGSAPAMREGQLWTWTLAPGDRYDAEPDPIGWHEMLLVTAGRLRIDRELDGTVVVECGEHAVYTSAQSYAYINAGDGPVEFVRVVLS
jgi:transcriptional regulator with XRE-family HTH domain